MPELPEVESISRSLDKLVSRRTIAAAELLRQRLVPDLPTDRFASLLKDQTINFVHRRGKNILFDLSGGKTLLVHLRMSGRFSLLPPERENPKFTHAVFHLAEGDRLVFDDQRHFGLMRIVPTKELFSIEDLAKLAPEPFSDGFSSEYFCRVLKNSKKPLKELLLDQSKVCGVGNIYASEALFASGIHPALAANRLTRPRVARLREAVIAVLRMAVDHAATLAVDPENLEGSYFSGSDDPRWMVYDREGEACHGCNSPILRIKQAGRSTYFCRTCQRR